MIPLLEKINSFVWGVPTLILILGLGLYLSIGSGFAQIRLLPASIKAFLTPPKGAKEGVSPMEALCTALAATVGTGNLAGVAGAIAIGGPGAIFWMWVCAIFGMVTKMAEATLSVRYRERSGGEYLGGPMYMIRNALPKGFHWLASCYAFFGVVAAFGVGNATQINAVITGANQMILSFGFTPTIWLDLFLGTVLAALIGALLLGGAKGIGKAAERLVPIAASAYLLLSLAVLIARYQMLPSAFAAILQGAWDPKAVNGGFVGSVLVTLRTGVARGVFTNEAGMGTAGIAHAGAEVANPVDQGLLGIMEVFLDTIVICTMTALVILVSGVAIPYGTDPGVELTSAAFSAVCGDWVSVFITAALCCFAIATVLGWGLYGARCAQYLFGENSWAKFVILQAVTVILGSVLKTGTVWLLAETVNGLMAIPNLLALAALSPEFFRLLKEYERKKELR